MAAGGVAVGKDSVFSKGLKLDHAPLSILATQTGLFLSSFFFLGGGHKGVGWVNLGCLGTECD